MKSFIKSLVVLSFAFVLIPHIAHSQCKTCNSSWGYCETGDAMVGFDYCGCKLGCACGTECGDIPTQIFSLNLNQFDNDLTHLLETYVNEYGYLIISTEFLSFSIDDAIKNNLLRNGYINNVLDLRSIFSDSVGLYQLTTNTYALFPLNNDNISFTIKDCKANNTFNVYKSAISIYAETFN